jgi:hypothetical protein
MFLQHATVQIARVKTTMIYHLLLQQNNLYVYHVSILSLSEKE